jgi:hypothetical protein
MNMGITVALTAGLQQHLLEEGCAVSIDEPNIGMILTELQHYQFKNRDGKAKLDYQASIFPENAVTGPSRVVEMIQNNLNSLVKLFKVVEGEKEKKKHGTKRVWKVKKIGRKEKADKLIDNRGGIGLWTDDPALLGNDIQEDAKMPAKKTSSHEHDEDPQQTPKNDDPTKKRSKRKESVGEMKEEDHTEKLDEEDKNRNQEEEQPAANETPQAPGTRQNEQNKQQKKRKGVENEDSIASKKSSRAKTPPKRFC